MAIYLVAVAKMHFLQWFKLSALLWPFTLYLPVSRHVVKVFDTVSNASSLLAFRLHRILAVGRPHDEQGDLSRMERALRLFCQEVLSGASHFPHQAIDEASLHVLHTVAL